MVSVVALTDVDEICFSRQSCCVAYVIVDDELKRMWSFEFLGYVAVKWFTSNSLLKYIIDIELHLRYASEIMSIDLQGDGSNDNYSL